MNRKRKNGEGTWGIKKVGNYTYRFYRYPDGKEIYGKTESEVWKKRDEWENNPVSKIQNRDFITYTVEEYYIWWLENEIKGTITQRTYDDYEYIATHYLKLLDYDLAYKQMGSLNKQMVQKYVNTLAKKYSLAVVKKTCGIISRCFEFAKVEKHIAENYMDMVKMPSESNVAVKKKEAAYLLPEDFPKLFAEAERVNNGEKGANGLPGTPVYGINAYIVLASLTCGTRISELLGLKKKNLHLEEKYIEIQQTQSRVRNRDKNASTKWKTIEASPKSKNSMRKIPISDKTVSFFEKILSFNPELKDDDFICINQSGNLCKADSINKTLKRMLRRSNCSIDECSTHALRHSYGSYLISTGAPLIIVSRILGHSSVKVTESVYIHILEEDKHKYIDTAFKKFERNPFDSFSEGLQNA